MSQRTIKKIVEDGMVGAITGGCTALAICICTLMPPSWFFVGSFAAMGGIIGAISGPTKVIEASCNFNYGNCVKIAHKGRIMHNKAEEHRRLYGY